MRHPFYTPLGEQHDAVAEGQRKVDLVRKYGNWSQNLHLNNLITQANTIAAQVPESGFFNPLKIAKFKKLQMTMATQLDELIAEALDLHEGRKQEIMRQVRFQMATSLINPGKKNTRVYLRGMRDAWVEDGPGSDDDDPLIRNYQLYLVAIEELINEHEHPAHQH